MLRDGERSRSQDVVDMQGFAEVNRLIDLAMVCDSSAVVTTGNDVADGCGSVREVLARWPPEELLAVCGQSAVVSSLQKTHN